MKKIDSTVLFYDQLAEDYHLIFGDWERSIKRQAELLKKLILSYSKIKKPKVLDCSCGIGTQAIALASKGYEVTATDISPEQIKHARKEAIKRRLQIRFGVADFRKLNTQVPDSFDIIISFDNALPHLLSDADMKKAIKNIYLKLNHQGYFFASIRDYDKAIKEKPKFTSPYEMKGSVIRRVVFQIWDWQKNNIYELNHFILKEKGKKMDISDIISEHIKNG